MTNMRFRAPRRTTRRALLAVSALALVAPLTACGGGSDTAEETARLCACGTTSRRTAP